MKTLHARLTAVLILAAVAAVWAATIGPAGGPQVGLGRYSTVQLAANCLLWLPALLACYVVLGGQAWKRRTARAGLCLAGVLLAVVLVELPAALGLLDYRTLLFPRLSGGPGPDHLRRDGELVFRHLPYGSNDQVVTEQPGSSPGGGEQVKIECRFDRHGFRNPADLDAAELVLIGDSFVEGFKVPQPQTSAAELRRILPAEVCNLGHDDYGPPQELIVLRRYGLPLSPRVVVWFFFEGNDLLDLEDHRAATTGWQGLLTRGDGMAARGFCLNALKRLDLWMAPLRWRDPGLLRDFSARLLPEIGDGRVVMHFGGYYGWGQAELSPRELELWAKAQDVLEQARSLCREAGVELLLVNIPTKFRVYRDLCVPTDDGRPGCWKLSDLPDRLRQWSAAAGVEYLDLTAALTSAARRGPLVYFADDGHWTRHGHAIAASQVAQVIRRAGWLDADPASP